MIRKFQQGGQQDAILQFVQGLAQTLQADPEQIVQIAQQNPEALKAAVQTYEQTQDMGKAAQIFAQYAQKQAQKAAHGAKLQYLRTLKNRCAEDEEIVYYKRGGSLKCGCQKKEDGGPFKNPVNIAKNKIQKFKEDIQKKLQEEQDKRMPSKNTPKRTPEQQKKIDKVSEEDYNKGSQYKKKYEKGGSAVDRFKAARCGSKMKKHQDGGSLNGVPFYQNGYVINTNRMTPEEANAINNREKQIAKTIITTQSPTIPNLWEAVKHAWNGWIDPVTPYNTGVAPTPAGITKAKNAYEALKMVNAMKAQKAAQIAEKAAQIAEKATARSAAAQRGALTRKINGNARGGTRGLKKLESVPDIPNYQEIYDGYKMTRASRLNLENVLNKLPDNEREMVMKVMASDPDHYLYSIGNITPSRAGSMISTIRRRLPIKYTPLRVKSLDQTRPHMGTGFFQKITDNVKKTAGFKRTTNKY